MEVGSRGLHSNQGSWSGRIAFACVKANTDSGGLARRDCFAEDQTIAADNCAAETKSVTNSKATAVVADQ
jgi:hypothetical protein